MSISYALLTHVIEPNSNSVVEIVKDWNDDCKQYLWNIPEELNVGLVLYHSVRPLLELEDEEASKEDSEEAGEDGGCGNEVSEHVPPPARVAGLRFPRHLALPLLPLHTSLHNSDTMYEFTWYWTLGSDSISLLLSPVPHSWESSADRRFQDTKYTVAQITLKKEKRTNPMSSTNSARPLKKICKCYI